MEERLTRNGAARFSAAVALLVVAMLLTAASRSGRAQTKAPAPPQDSEKLQSEFLFDIALDTLPPNSVGADRLIVPVSGGTFEGPGLKGTVVPPGGDWIVRRPDGSSVLDVRLVLQTDDGQKISMSWRGISHTPPGGAQYARITPMFETGAAKYAWLNNVVAVGVLRRASGRVGYRVYRIL